jgi:ribonuclease HI
MISWETMTQPKWCGGMGLRKLQIMNEACLMKLGWSLMVGEQSLWGDVLIGKYGRSGWSQGMISVNTSDSSLWKALAKSWTNLNLHRCWSIGDGYKVNFWTDKWLDESTRICDHVDYIPEAVCQLTVKDVTDSAGEWNFHMIQNLIPPHISEKLHAIVPPHDSQGSDMLFWPGTTSGLFSVSSAYHIIAGDTTKEAERRWMQIWKIKSIERVRVFIWQLVHDRLLTKSRLYRWHIGNPFCHLCSQFEETSMHVIRDCTIAVQVWKHLLNRQEWGCFFTVEFQDWINLNLNNAFGQRYGKEWISVWATTCFLLWQWRNKSTHDTEFVYPLRPWQVIVDYVETYKLSTRVEQQAGTGRVKRQVNINWIPPPHGWYALNSDGAAKIGSKRAGCGGLLRNDAGVWIDGFVKKLGDTNAYMAELWGIYEGLKLALRHGVMHLELRTDSQIIVQSLQNSKEGSILGCALMKKIKRLVDGPWEVRIIHIFREANRCADMLANMGCESSSGTVYFDKPPSRVAQIVEDDIRGVSFPRLISV